MSQITSGFRSILTIPYVYTAFQALMGADRSRRSFVGEHVKPWAGMSVLDIGCGPGDILKFLPEVQYYGFDICLPYISEAQRKFEGRGVFHCALLTENHLAALPKFDVVLATGLLHHLDDTQAVEILTLARNALKQSGRLITIDPCFTEDQSSIARFLIRNDRGRNVRDRTGYGHLAHTVFEDVITTVKNQSWIPYTHCIMECKV